MHSRQHDWLGWQSIRKPAPSGKIARFYLPWAALKLLCLVGVEILLLLSAVRKSTAVFTVHTEWGLSPVHSNTLRGVHTWVVLSELNCLTKNQSQQQPHPPIPLKTQLLLNYLHPLYGLILFTESKSLQQEMQWCGKASSFRTHPFTGGMRQHIDICCFCGFITIPERLDH